VIGGSSVDPTSASYGPVSGGYGANGGASGGTTTSCSGAITATFNWTGIAPAPQSAIVVETSTVFASADCYGYQAHGPPSAACADGMGDTATINTSYPPHNSQEVMSGSVSRTRYTNQGGQTITLNCSPSASAYTPNGPASHADVAYSAAVYPVTISLGGATQVNGADEALTGQTISATLSLGGASGCTASHYQWSASGGSPFETWNNTTPATASAPANPNASYYAPISPGDADTTGATFTFNDATSGDQVSVTCTATVTFPDGTTGTVTAKSLTVTFLKPTGTWIVDGPGTNPPAGLWYGSNQEGGTSIPANSMGAYEWWSPTSLTLPSAFTSTGGKGCFSQVIHNEGGSFTGTLGTYVGQYPIDGSTSYGSFVTGLDLEFPYESLVWAISTSTGIGVAGGDGDVPTQPYQAGNDQYGDPTSGWMSAQTASNSYSTWLMYCPPGGIWVPVQTITWGWSAEAQNAAPDNPPGKWSFSGTLSSPASPNAVTGAGTVTSTPPSWNHVVGQGKFFLSSG
jgi:hypothetical protein